VAYLQVGVGIASNANTCRNLAASWQAVSVPSTECASIATTDTLVLSCSTNGEVLIAKTLVVAGITGTLSGCLTGRGRVGIVHTTYAQCATIDGFAVAFRTRHTA